MNDFDTIGMQYAYGGKLGAVWTAERTSFAVWSPAAESAELRLYHDDSEAQPFRTEIMRNENGVWKAEIPGDQNGVYYTYAFTHGGNTAETIDIYARSCGANGKRGMILDLRATDPDGWENDEKVKLPDYTDAVIYELHVRDFSSDESGKFTLRGKFGAFCEKAVNGFGDTIGLDYIKKLGVTHIHLLPVFDYQSVDENDPGAGFNWGYDPLNYNIPEGSYSTDPHRGEARVREFKQLVQAAHERGIGVIMDVVYNHTYATEDSPFNKTFPGYYYRHNADGTLSNGSACGNEFASERAMASRFIADSLLYWAREYHIDGFRFDLMGLLDIATLNSAAAELRAENPSVILYGEGWTGGECPLPEELRAMKMNARMLPQFAMFSDDFRDGVKGSVFSDEDCGYVNGKAAENAELIKSVISGGIWREDVGRASGECWADKPQQSVNYVEAHDNLTLYDKLRSSMPGASESDIAAADKLAAALVFLSQGVPFIQAGQEILRSKTAADGSFVHDSYNSPDSVNSIKWNDITLRRGVMEYYRGLIAARKRFPQLRMRDAESIRRIRFETLDGGAISADMGGLLLIVNPCAHPLRYENGKRMMVFADHISAGARPLFIADGAVSVAPHGIILAEYR